MFSLFGLDNLEKVPSSNDVGLIHEASFPTALFSSPWDDDDRPKAKKEREREMGMSGGRASRRVQQPGKGMLSIPSTLEG